MAKTFISYLGIFNKDIFGAFGKLATIWFDEIILDLPNPVLLEKVIAYGAEKGKISEKITNDFLKAWKPINEYCPKYKWKAIPSIRKDKELTNLAYKVVYEATKKEYPGEENTYGFIREVAWGGAGLINSINAWKKIHAKIPCSYLAHQLEAEVIKRTFAKDQENMFDIFSEYANYKIPDLSNIPWDKVFELRCHPYLEAFRRKLSSLQEVNDSKLIIEIVKEIEKKDMKQLTLLCKPAPIKMAVKTICSNIPVPYVNPISILTGIADLINEIKKEKKYGWLYFIFDLEE